MPKLATIGNIQILVFNFDTKRHKAPHFHAVSPNGDAVIGIADLTVLESSLKGKGLSRVLAWAAATGNAQRLADQWNASNPQQPMRKK